MGIFSKRKAPEKKNQINMNFNSILNSIRGVNKGETNITVQKSLEYYNEVAPLADSIDMIAKRFSNIPAVLYNKNNDEYITDSEVIDLLNKPNPDQTGEEFKKEIATFLNATGNCYLLAGGTFSQKPIELSVINPVNVNVKTGADGYALTYKVSTGNTQQTFNRVEDIKGFRFISVDGLSELYHIKLFTPKANDQHILGQSPMQSILSEILQYKYSSTHNLSLLKNGARLSGILLKEGILDSDVREMLSEQFKNNLQGVNNAGEIMFAETGDGKVDFKELSQSNKDMDFYQLKQDAKLMIYKRYDIPLPLVSTEHMTLSNYTEAKLALLTDAVLPLTDKINEELTKFLLPRYKEDKYIITYNMNDIPALVEKNNNDIVEKQKTGVFTINEVRAMYGNEPTEGGDQIYQPATLVPLGQTDVPVPADTIKSILERTKA